MKTKPGCFIVLEGLEGSGKSTALQVISQILTDHKINYITTREPGGTRVGEVVRSLIKETVIDQPLSKQAELLLMYAARSQLLEQVIRPALNQGTWVIADRFEPSTYAYQGGGRKIDEKIIDHLSAFCVQDTKPDLLVFLDVPADLGLKRAQQRGELDRIEQESLDFFHNVYNGYHNYLKKHNTVAVIDATLSLEQVQKDLHAVFVDFLNKNSTQLELKS